MRSRGLGRYGLLLRREYLQSAGRLLGGHCTIFGSQTKETSTQKDCGIVEGKGTPPSPAMAPLKGKRHLGLRG